MSVRRRLFTVSISVKPIQIASLHGQTIGFIIVIYKRSTVVG